MWKLGLALIIRSLTSISGYNNSEVEMKSTPNLPYDMKLSGLLSILFLLVKKSSGKGASIISSEQSSQ